MAKKRVKKAKKAKKAGRARPKKKKKAVKKQAGKKVKRGKQKKAVKKAKKKPAAKKEIEPKSFIEQLGIKEGHVIVCLHCKEQFISRLRNQLPRCARVYPTVKEGKPPDIIIRFFNELADFDASFRWLRKQLNEGGCIWGVIPRKNALKKGQRYLKEEMTKHARRNDMINTKTFNFSLFEQGIRFCKKKR